MAYVPLMCECAELPTTDLSKHSITVFQSLFGQRPESIDVVRQSDAELCSKFITDVFSQAYQIFIFLPHVRRVGLEGTPGWEYLIEVGVIGVDVLGHVTSFHGYDIQPAALFLTFLGKNLRHQRKQAHIMITPWLS